MSGYLFGEQPLFPDGLPFARPTLEDAGPVLADLGKVLDSGLLTDGPYGRRLEEAFAERIGVAHCVAVSSCTIGLILVLQALAGDVRTVALPSFTFSATGHAALWNGLEPRFADCRPDTWCIDAESVPEADAILAVHVSGMACNVAALAALAANRRVPLLYDAAHAAGSSMTVDGVSRPLGSFGLAEVFSLTPTKVLSGAEGGLITTNDANLAARLRIARNYGNPGDYDTLFAGVNARLSELHAVPALHALRHLDERVAARNRRAATYVAGLNVPGIGFQEVPTGSVSSYKDFTVTIDSEQFGADRDHVAAVLGREGIQTRRYYSPPLHRQRTYREFAPADLPATDLLADRVLTLPMWSHLPFEAVEKVCESVHRIHQRAASG